jgi:hypothetical protein
MIERILNHFGYIKDAAVRHTELTEDELSYMLACRLGVLDEIDAEYEKKIFSDLKGTDGLVQYLREAAARDKDRYFGAQSKEEQLVIRGSFARTMYLKSKIMTVDDAPKKTATKVDGVKYG